MVALASFAGPELNCNTAVEPTLMEERLYGSRIIIE